MSVRQRALMLMRIGSKLKETLSGTNIPTPPFNFAVQVGDPVLRKRAENVKPEDIKSPEIQKLILSMRDVMKRNHTFGISACQVGVPLRVFLTELPHDAIGQFPREELVNQQIIPWSCKVFINPKLVIEDSSKLTHKEGCLSVQGFTADVPRAMKVKVEGLNEAGLPHCWTVSHFAARVVQHEMDHLDGKLFVDIMNPLSFQFVLWKYVQQLPRARKGFGGL
ncbi:polypeptide deformylase-like [Tropilaelaps mercedesae]|uniref:Peptide deformylase n=1 Tax=Tropilaelaps mercedesae TaxID=418985 RepID=A0A1V9X9J7_9ACAR|nr:polypeptide deformylase-like [Tropilaelaps mercedesae]